MLFILRTFVVWNDFNTNVKNYNALSDWVINFYHYKINPSKCEEYGYRYITIYVNKFSVVYNKTLLFLEKCEINFYLYNLTYIYKINLDILKNNIL